MIQIEIARRPGCILTGAGPTPVYGPVPVIRLWGPEQMTELLPFQARRMGEQIAQNVRMIRGRSGRPGQVRLSVPGLVLTRDQSTVSLDDAEEFGCRLALAGRLAELEGRPARAEYPTRDESEAA